VRLWELASGKELTQFKGHQGGVLAVVFSPDGSLLLSGGGDCTMLLWDATGLKKNGRLPSLRLSGEELTSRWRELGETDAGRAQRVIWELTASPREAVPFLGERLQPVAVPDPARIARLVANLDSEAFALRTAAAQELEQLAELAGPALRKLLTEQPSPEARRHAEQLLDKLDSPLLAGERLRQRRALAVLEQVANTEARQLLDQLARGAADAWLTKQARAALRRLERTTAPPE
jgi:hypothetical protein